MHGEAGSAAIVTSVQIKALQELLEQYPSSDCYNMDKIGLFYQMVLDKTIAQQQIAGVKKQKTRLTIALMVNETGLSCDFLIIGTAAKPRCFGNRSAKSMGFYYCNNKKAWMTGLLFQEYVWRLNQSVNHSVFLLVNGGPHSMGDYQLQYVNVVVLPPNTTSRIQTFDAKIIQAFKMHYCH